MNDMNQTDDSKNRFPVIFRIWWYISWRTWLSTLGMLQIFIIIANILVHIMDFQISNIEMYVNTLTFFVGILLHIYFIGKAINRKFAGYSLVLEKASEG